MHDLQNISIEERQDHHPDDASRMHFAAFYIFVDKDFLTPGRILNGIRGAEFFQDLILGGLTLSDFHQLGLLDRLSPSGYATGDNKEAEGQSTDGDCAEIAFSPHPPSLNSIFLSPAVKCQL